MNRIMIPVSCIAILLGLCASNAISQTLPSTMPTTQPAKKPSVTGILERTDDWFKSDEGRQIVANIISWQNANGGWWKSYEFAHPKPDPYPDPVGFTGPPGDDWSVWKNTSTIDNDATYTEVKILARAVSATGDETVRKAFDRGLQFLIDAQYANGGWPQRFPIEQNYGRMVTFNDGAMIGVMNVMRSVAAGKNEYAFVPEETRSKAKAAFDNGVAFILNSQIKIDGKLTIWCQQHDPDTLAAAGARAYELPALVTTESMGILTFLMSLENPSERVIQSIEAGCDWYESTAITGKRWKQVYDPKYEMGTERMLIDDPTAPRLWGRFYDLKTQKPFFCDRTGIPQDSVEKISHERRVLYQWYNMNGDKLQKAYGEWKQKLGLK